MNISNVNVYGLNESIVASGYPKKVKIEKMKTPEEKDFARAFKLAQAKIGSGHDCFLKGIVVQFDLIVPTYLWIQLQRYTHLNIVSSQSKMHSIGNMNLDEMSNDFVNGGILTILDVYQEQFVKGKLSIEQMISNIPLGFEYGARLTTNYLQLKTIYHQRKNHKLREWQEICKWIETLPYAKELIIGGRNEF